MDAPETIVLTLPEPPSANRLYRRGAKGHAHESSESKAYKEAVAMLASRYRKGTECAFPSGDLSVSVLWHRSAKRGDLPNRTKVLYDALQGTIYRDDKQIAVEHTQRVDQHATLKRGFMRVEIARLKE